jgi:hypothetical protein
VKDFSTIAAPLNELAKKGVEFVWGAAQDNAFDEQKRLLTSAPLLALPLLSNLRLNVMLVALVLVVC